MNFVHRIVRSKRMTDVLMIVGFLLAWVALQYVILPKLGVGT